MDYLEFEQPIAELEAKIEELRRVGSDSELNLSEEIGKLQSKCDSLTESIFAKLTPWQVAQLARHPQRPYTLDYVGELITDFNELYGDRLYSNDSAIISGIGRFEETSVAIIGHQKGRSTNENLKRNFGMPRPEGYRKALRIMEMAEKFCMPIFTFIDTPGAYPGVGAEERGQSLAIARNLYRMSQLKTPIICTVIGEGGSGGALAIGVGDHLAMLSYSTYSVISPEGCASILWKSADNAQEAAEAMGITSDRLLELGLIDEIVQEPRRGAHHDFAATAENLRKMLSTNLSRLSKIDTSDLVQQRFKRLTSYGVYK